MGDLAIDNPGRRWFLRAAPVAAAAGIALADASLFSAHAQDAASASGASFQLFNAATLADDIKALDANPGNNNLVDDKTFVMMLTTEKAKSAKEFEWHEGRDHIFHILDGSTVYELGGTPKGGHSTKPGEWLAPESEGATRLTLNKGDLLVVRRGTPHRRTTADSVTLLLISPQGTVSA
jgi:mannose-6-phosphate isomerase-like protein (cupin superfamily)